MTALEGTSLPSYYIKKGGPPLHNHDRVQEALPLNAQYLRLLVYLFVWNASRHHTRGSIKEREFELHTTVIYYIVMYDCMLMYYV